MKKYEFNGKDYIRAYRRHCSKKKLKSRAKKYQDWYSNDYSGIGCRIKSWTEVWKEIQQGKFGHWIRTTGTPCSCDMCSPISKREQSQYFIKQAWKDIGDMEDDLKL